jgi:hypothetical protein
MRQWHVEHMEKIVVKYIKGLSENASAWEKRQHKRYGKITNTCRSIDYDIKHGVTSPVAFTKSSKPFIFF